MFDSSKLRAHTTYVSSGQFQVFSQTSFEPDSSPRVGRLSVTPIKGLRLHHPETIEVTPAGPAGDRRFFLVNDEDKPVSITANGRLALFEAEFDMADERLTLFHEDGRRWEARVEFGDEVSADFYGERLVSCNELVGPWSEALSTAVKEPVRLVGIPAGAGGFDIQPVTIVGSASIDELARQAGLESVDPRRFRMTIDLVTDSPHVEDTWDGRLVSVGEAQLRIGGAVPRCAAVTRRPGKGDRDVPLVKMIRSYRGVTTGPLGKGVHFGVYASVERPGRIAVGDELVLAPTDAKTEGTDT